MSRPAVFVDRDGTLVEDPPPGYLSDPARVALFPGVIDAINSLHAAGFAVVLVTNQAGIARGLVSPEQYRAVAARMEELLARGGARLDGTWMCPHAPEVSGECPCRKPGTLLFQQAALALDLDLAASWFVGDRITDLIPGRVLGGRGGILLLTGLGSKHRAAAEAAGFPVAAGLREAAALILAEPG